MGRALVITLMLLVTNLAHAQTDLGTITLAYPARRVSGDFVVVDRLPVPRADPSEVPIRAAGPLDRYYGATEIVIALSMQAAQSTPAQRVALAPMLEGYEAERRYRRALLETALGDDLEGLGPAALLVLGELRYEDVMDAAIDEAERCEAAGGASCLGVFGADTRAATRAWSHVTGIDERAAHALYQRAYVAHESGDPEERTLIDRALAIAPLPAELEQRLQFALGDLVASAEPDVARRAFERCASLALRLAPHCAIRVAEIDLAQGRPMGAIAALASHLVTQEPARVLAGEAMLALDHPALPATLPSWTRASLLAIGADRLATLGLVERAHAWLDAAVALDPMLEAQRASLPSAAVDTPAAWLARAVTFCMHRVDIGALTALDVRARITPSHASIRVVRAHPTAAPGLNECLIHHAPMPESSLDGSFRASIVIGP